MIPTTAILAFFSKIGPAIKSSWPFIKKNWKNILLIGFLIWIIICCMSHCGNSGRINSGGIDTVSVDSDTAWQFADTNAIFALHGFDTLPAYVQELENRVKFKPKTPVIRNASNSTDSLIACIKLLEECNKVLIECDSMYGDAVAIRSYSDSLRTDSIVIYADIKTKGTLFGEPKIKYRYLAPYPVITNTITLKETIVIGPFRKVYLEGGAGPTMTWDNKLFAVSGSLGLGYTDKKNWSYGLRGTFNQNGYAVEVAFRKSFNVGK